MRKIKIMKDFDQYYTDKNVANYCMKVLKGMLKENISEKDVFLEPSAGTGAFVDSVSEVFPDNEIIAYDIDPKREYIIKGNFLEVDLREYNNLITVGNPPFGKRAKFALKFYEKTMQHSKIVAFIVPIQFNKWFTQNKVNLDFKLIHNELLKPNSFTFNNEDYSIRSVFQIWTREDFGFVDLRLTKAPPTKHSDFECWQYNCTKSTIKYFNCDWDFAVIRQGYGDYNVKIYDKSKLNKSRQYMFLKAHNKHILDNLLNIDFEELSKLNTSTPGFGKADLVNYYINSNY